MACLDSKLLKNSNQFVTSPVLDSHMVLDTHDAGLSRDLLVDGIREPDSASVIKGLIRPGQTVIDVGANIGYYALLESRLVGENGRVIAIEPVRDNTRLLEKSIALNGYRNIRVLDMAVGDRIGTAKMQVGRQRNLSRVVTGANSSIETTGEIVVIMYSLDDLKIYPDVIRMDVEGYEYEIIKGMKGILASGKPLTLCIELHPSIMGVEKTAELLRTLKEAGMEVSAAVIDAPIRGAVRHKLLGRLAWFSLSRAMGYYGNRGLIDLTIDDMLSNPKYLSGEYPVAQVFFSR